MFSIKRIRTGSASLVALMALAVGGSAIANAAQSTPSSSPPAVTSMVDTPTAGDKADSAADVPTAGDRADPGTESGSEISGADGPSGHADESPAQR